MPKKGNEYWGVRFSKLKLQIQNLKEKNQCHKIFSSQGLLYISPIRVS